MTKWDTLHRIEGLYVGLLTQEELEIFNKACRTNDARRSYEGAGGAMGLAKVRLFSLASQERSDG
ncbi:hypothetical protein [Bradyrhizobium icense]|uniref:Uncharacterized protein n=1 Tax=Bradyrhizobium icense TaxID=1274631 RepID=A0A1B1UD23_9BRAD|nr:hypothetical protein [Bradyrhizobium icense]ANW00653.1 hypothetical protein LMTR13_11240 [Bradyrhizobium icense]